MNMEMKVNNKKIESIKDIKNANLVRRSIAYFFDFLVIIFLFLFAYLPTVEGYIDYGFHINQKLDEVKEIQLNSKLFFNTSSDENKKEVSYVNSSILQDENGYFTYDSYKVFLDRLYYFYYESEFIDEVRNLIFDDNSYTIEEFNSWFYTNVLFIDNEKYYGYNAFYILDGNKNSSPLIKKENDEYIYNIGVLNEATYGGKTYKKYEEQKFNTENNQYYIQTILKLFADTDEIPGSYHQACLYLKDTSRYSEIYLTLERIGRYVRYISFGFSGLIYFFITPLIFRNGETIGMKLMHVGLVTKDGYQVKKVQVFLHSLFNFCELFIGQFTYFLFYLVDYVLIIINKEHRSIADFIAVTKMIDTKNSVWFVSKDVEDKLLAQVNENLDKANLEKND